MPRVKSLNGKMEAQLVFQLPVRLREEFEAVAEQNERTLSQELRRALRRHIAAEKVIREERERAT